MSKNTDEKIDNLVDLMERLLNKEVNPVAPVAPIITQFTGDHDLLTKLDTKVDNLQTSVDSLSKSYVPMTTHEELAKCTSDHETRVRILEQSMWKWVGVSSTIATGISVIIVILGKFLKVE